MLLEIKDLKVHYPIRKGFFNRIKDYVHAVDGISLCISEGMTYGLVGESGCGKTTTGRSILGLNKITSGSITFDGAAVNVMFNKNRHPLRKEIQMIFQDPYSSLNPNKQVRDIIAEPLVNFQKLAPQELHDQIVAIMTKVGLTEDSLYKYPHQFSGGQRQRIGIARALTLNPRLIIADEPVSALDVSVQAQVLNFMKEIQADFGLTYLFISHDLGIVRHMCDRIGVMFQGKLVEEGTPDDIFHRAQHIYTKKLISSIPIEHPQQRAEKQQMRAEINQMYEAELGRVHDATGKPFPLKQLSDTHFAAIQ